MTLTGARPVDRGSRRTPPASRGGSAGTLRPADVAQLGQKLAHAIDREQIPGPSAPCGSSRTPPAYDEQLARLRDWIDGVLIPEYGPFVTWLRPCWPSHRPVLWELSVAWAYWRLTYDRSKPSLADAVFFHDRLLPGV